jgi:hypothetical protein
VRPWWWKKDPAPIPDIVPLRLSIEMALETFRALQSPETGTIGKLYSYGEYFRAQRPLEQWLEEND